MKHYMYIGVLPADTGVVKGYAPFDGTVSIQSEQFPMGVQVIIQGENGWRFRRHGFCDSRGDEVNFKLWPKATGFSTMCS
jgi:hypothetical protein